MSLPLSSDELQLNIKSDLVLRVGKICLAAGTGLYARRGKSGTYYAY